MTQRGFTLLEMLIAIALFSLLGMACYQLLERTQRSEQSISRHELQLRQLQRALGIFERDLLQAIAIPLSQDPDRTSALIGTASELYLVRSGWSNPLNQPRSDLLEVHHYWQDGIWRRDYQSPPTEAGKALEQQTSSRLSQTLLSEVTVKQLRYIDFAGQPHATWPIQGTPLSLPIAIELVVNAPGFSDIRRVILLPGQQLLQSGAMPGA
ncbi:MAG: type II secretion system minor pseudopilin GspJ [Pseudomonas sp.]|uniref:type II secretion system minor pseudopilin GspJ n=1 Tax=Pseudomonas sp. TaxID=306 RepID=UPI0030F03A12